MPTPRTPAVRLLAEFAFTVVPIVAGCTVFASLGGPHALMVVALPGAGPYPLDLPIAAVPLGQPPKRWPRDQQVLSRRDYRTTGAAPSYPIRSPQAMPLVLMKPRQIVRGFTYRGIVLEDAPAWSGARRRPAGWPELRAIVRAQEPLLSAPEPGCIRLCAVCRGPSGAGSARCFQCDLHEQCAAGSLADLVVPVAYAIKGALHARRLWQYKSPRMSQAAAAGAGVILRAMLLVFLRDHGSCLWQAAAAAGGTRVAVRPTHLAVVPTARGRPGEHPLRALVHDYLATPWAELTARPGGEQVRDLDPERFAAGPVPGAQVLLVDDTWTTG